MRLCLAAIATVLALYVAAVAPVRSGAAGGAWSARFADGRVTLALRPDRGERTTLVVPRGALTELQVDGGAAVGGQNASVVRFLLAFHGGRLRFRGVMHGDVASGRYSPAGEPEGEAELVSSRP